MGAFEDTLAAHEIRGYAVAADGTVGDSFTNVVLANRHAKVKPGDLGSEFGAEVVG